MQATSKRIEEFSNRTNSSSYNLVQNHATYHVSMLSVVTLVPNITNICYGRGVGYKIEEIVLSEEIQKISATKIREKMREDGDLK